MHPIDTSGKIWCMCLQQTKNNTTEGGGIPQKEMKKNAVNCGHYVLPEKPKYQKRQLGSVLQTDSK